MNDKCSYVGSRQDQRVNSIQTVVVSDFKRGPEKSP